MRQWGYPVPPEELISVTRAAEMFRQKWNSICPPRPAAFDGTITDVEAIDYLDYEGIDYSECGFDGTALVCGEVLRRAADLEWVVSYRGDWLIVSAEDHVPGVAIYPRARLHESECGSGPQIGKHRWFLQQAAFECLLTIGDPSAEAALFSLLINHDDGNYTDRVERALERLHRGRKWR